MSIFLVTGGAGFIGSNLCEKLLEQGHKVRVLDNLSSGKESNLKDFIGSIEFIKGDIRDKTSVSKAVKGVDFVIHLAALGSVPRSVADPETTHEVNTTGTLNVLKTAKDLDVKRVVCASSSSVYGDTPVLPKKEEMVTNPQSPYAVSKLTAEHYCRVFNRVYGLETVALRYFNVYGKRQDPLSQYAAVVPKFITSLLKDESPTIYGDGEQTRDFTYIDDCNQANIKACFSERCAGGFYNIGYGSRISINELYNKIKSTLNKNINAVHVAPRQGDVRDSLADISKAREGLSYEPKFNIYSGIEKTVEWYLNNFSRIVEK